MGCDAITLSKSGALEAGSPFSDAKSFFEFWKLDLASLLKAGKFENKYDTLIKKAVSWRRSKLKWQRWAAASVVERVVFALHSLRIFPVKNVLKMAHLSESARAFAVRVLEGFELLKGTQVTKKGSGILSSPGLFLDVEAHRPMLLNLNEYSSKHPKKLWESSVDKKLKNDVDDSEKYWGAVSDFLKKEFDWEAVPLQAKYICQFDCQSGLMLKKAYEMIKSRTQRGKNLAKFPLTVIGVESKDSSTEKLKENLNGVPSIVLEASSPSEILVLLKRNNIDPRNVVFLQLVNTLSKFSVSSSPSKTTSLDDVCCIDSTGGIVTHEDARKWWEGVFRSWQSVLAHNNHGLLLLQNHIGGAHDAAAFVNEFLFGMSGKPLLTAKAATECAANNGLFATSAVAYPLRFPGPRKGVTGSSASALHLTSRPYIVRRARAVEVDRLLELEKSWDLASLQADARELRRRLKTYPEGQFVLCPRDESRVGAPIAALYSQRIQSAASIKKSSDLPKLFKRDGVIVQLIAAVSDPSFAQYQPAHSLLVHVLQLLHFSGFSSVVAVTRWSGYKSWKKKHSGSKKSEYESLKNAASGYSVDPTVSWHEARGAKVLRVLPEYRPEDTDNEGDGVLIEYSLPAKDESAKESKRGTAKRKEVKDSVGLLKKLVGEILVLESEDINITQSLLELQLTSLDLVQLRQDICSSFGLNHLSPTIFFEYPSIAALASYLSPSSNVLESAAYKALLEAIYDVSGVQKMKSTMVLKDAGINLSKRKKLVSLLSGRLDKFVRISDIDIHTPLSALAHRLESSAPSFNSMRPFSKASSDRRRLHVAGVAFRIPNHSNNFDEALNADFIGKPERTELAGLKFEGGFLSESAVWGFDAPFFHISPREGSLMDPQQRVLLQCSWHALEDANVNPDNLFESGVGVYIGAWNYDFAREATVDRPNFHFGTGTATSAIAGRISYAFGFEGPSMVVDTACSSGLVALTVASESSVSQALVGAVNLILSPTIHTHFNAAGMLSPDFRCKTFDDSANGYVRSEACVVTFLQTAISSLDRATIHGCAVNQDGASNGFTAPKQFSQEKVIEAAIANSGLNRSKIHLFEAHGTGTPLGDPIELDSIANEYSMCNTNLVVSSVKTLVGHTEGAAGLVGLLKVVQCMQHNKMYRHLHFNQLNKHISEETMALLQGIIPSEEIDWSVNEKYAAVSSFGFSGTNSHVIVGDSTSFVALPHAAHDTSMNIMCITGKSEAAIKNAAKAYTGFLASSSASIARMCEELEQNKPWGGFRLVVFGKDSHELKRGLDGGEDLYAKSEMAEDVKYVTTKGVWKVKGDLRRELIEYWNCEVPESTRLLRSHMVTAEGAKFVAAALLPALEGWGVRVSEGPPGRRDIVVESGRSSAGRRHKMKWVHATGNVTAFANVVKILAENLKDRFQWSADITSERGGGLFYPFEDVVSFNPAVFGGKKKSRKVTFDDRSGETRPAEQEEVELVSPSNFYGVQDHLVFGLLILPGAFHVALCFDHVGGAVQVSDMSFLAPIRTDEGAMVSYKFKESGDGFEMSVESGEDTVAVGRVAKAGPSSKKLPREGEKALKDAKKFSAASYDSSYAVQWGKPFQWRVQEHFGKDFACAKIKCPDGPPSAVGFVDSVLQLCVLLASRTDFYVPAKIGKISLARIPSHGENADLFVKLKSRKKTSCSFDAWVTVEGKTVLWLQDFESVLSSKAMFSAEQKSLSAYFMRWTETKGDAKGKAKAGKFIVVGEKAFGNMELVKTATKPSLYIKSFAKLKKGRYSVVNATALGENFGGHWQREKHACCATLALVNALNASPHIEVERLWTLTRNAQRVTPRDAVELRGSSLWGFSRCIVSEFPDLNACLLDSDGDLTRAAAFIKSASPGVGTELALRGERRYECKLRKQTLESYSGLSHELQVGGKGELVLAKKETTTTKVGKGQVRVRVFFSGVENSQAVLKGKGAGQEFCGEVIDSGTNNFRVGEAVYGITFGGLYESDVDVDERFVSPVPRHALSKSQAASCPRAFLTALLCLKLSKHLKGSSVLVCDCYSGVGMAAVQLAKRVFGAKKVFGTAERVSKEGFMKGWGVDDVFSSSDLNFVGKIGKKAVDFILSSVDNEELVTKTLSTLKARGCFVDVSEKGYSKKKFKTHHPLSAFHAFALSKVGKKEPVEISKALQEISGYFEKGLLKPLPAKQFFLVAAQSGIDYMSQADRIGKAVFRHPHVVLDSREKQGVLLSGGWGGLGMAYSNWLSSKESVAYIALVGRSGARERNKGFAKNAKVSLFSARADITRDLTALRDEVASCLGSSPSLVMHLAGIVRDGPMGSASSKQLVDVLRTKIRGTLMLDEAFAASAQRVVLFSSISATLGSAGQSNYSSANAWMDAFAATNPKYLSINWGAWSGAGMFSALDEKARKALSYMKTYPLSSAGSVLETALESSDLCSIGMFDVDWEKLSGKRLLVGALEDFAVESKPRQNSQIDVAAILVKSIVDVLGLSGPEEITADASLSQLGLDSMLSVELRNVLSRATKLKLPATLLFDYPTLEGLVTYFSGRMGSGVSRLSTVRTMKTLSHLPEISAAKTGIMISGRSCRFADAWNAEELWKIFAGGKDMVGLVPGSRWDWREMYDPNRNAPGKSVCKWGCFFEGMELFDPAFFNISAREARSMDPQHRMLLECAWEAIESSGADPMQLRKRRGEVGVYVGMMSPEYSTSDFLVGTTGILNSAAAGRVSYYFGLSGSAMVIGTACSSAIVAMNQAVMSLQTGSEAAALVGGCSFMGESRHFVLRSHAGMLSEDGRCKTFDQTANGYVRGEGCGLLFIEEVNEDVVGFGRILGCSINQDGKSNGLTAPNGPSQTRLIKETMRKAGLVANSVSMLEAHGTGTSLGDPIEVQAAEQSYGQRRKSPLIMGSAKTNLGHCESSAGAVGMLKALLCMEKGIFAKHLHLNHLNDYIGTELLEGMQCVIPVEEIQWNASRRISGVSSFGFSGTNSHVILEGAVAEGGRNGKAPFVLFLSAKSEGALRGLAKSYAGHLTEQNIASACYCSRFGRSVQELRGAVAGESKAEMKSLLRTVEKKGTGAFAAEVGGAKMLMGADMTSLKVEEALKKQTKEGKLKDALPPYSFDRKSYWTEQLVLVAPGNVAKDLGQAPQMKKEDVQTFMVNVSKNPFYALQDHKVFGAVVMPGASHVCMVVEHALSVLGLGPAVLLEDVDIQTPVIIDDGDVVVKYEYRGEKGRPLQFVLTCPSSGDESPVVSGQVSALSAEKGGFDLDVLTGKKEETKGDAFWRSRKQEATVEWGKSFQWISRCDRFNEGAYLRATLASPAKEHKMKLPVALVDSMFQCCAVAGQPLEAKSFFAPFSFKRMEVRKSYAAEKEYVALVDRTSENLDQGTRTCDVFLKGKEEAPVVAIQGFRMVKASKVLFLRNSVSSKAISSKYMYEVEWKKSAPAAMVNKGRMQLAVFGYDKGFVDLFCKETTAVGSDARGQLIGEPISLTDGESVVVLASPGQRHSLSFKNLIELVQQSLKSSVPVFVVVSNAQRLDGGAVNPQQRAIWSLGRVLENEGAEGVSFIDVEGYDAKEDASLVLRELSLAQNTHREIAYRAGTRMVPSIVRVKELLDWRRDFSLVLGERKGDFSCLSFDDSLKGKAESGGVEVEVIASGLNFKDVLVAMDMVPSTDMGFEMSGYLKGKSSGVLGFAKDSFSSRVFTSRDLVVPKPKEMSFEDAATIPMAFCTALACMEKAKLGKRSSVLIHSAAGGVGVAATQLAKHHFKVKKIYGTAGRARKQNFAQSWGVDEVYSSRSAGFGKEIGTQTVDFVLNSLSGKGLIEKSVSVLKKGGFFAEIGAQGIWNKEEFKKKRPKATYFVYDLKDDCNKDRKKVKKLLTGLLADFKKGKLQPIPATVFPLRQARKAFQFMFDARHMGKVVFRHPQETVMKGMVVLSGGFGGLGSAYSKWLTDVKKVEGVLLMGRSGARTKESVQSSSAFVFGAKCDVTRSEDVRSLIVEARLCGGAQVGAVMHLAGVLEDESFSNLEWASFKKTIRPKVQGLYALRHAIAEDAKWILFSSVASMIGTVGQSSYGAANGFLDGFSEAVPSVLSVNWGAWSGAGMYARLDKALQRYETLSIEGAGKYMDTALLVGDGNIGMFNMAWRKYHGNAGALRDLLDAEGGARGLGETVAISSADIDELVEQLAKAVIGMDASEEIDPAQPLRDLGFDSMMSTELANSVSDTFEIPMSSTIAFDFPTLALLKKHISKAVRGRVETLPTVMRTRQASHEGGDVFVCGTACRFADSWQVEDFWKIFVEGRDMVTVIPRSRWDWNTMYNPRRGNKGTSVSKWGSFFEGVSQFDAGFFKISPREARTLDPGHRMLLECSWEAAEGSGLDPQALEQDGKLVSVCVGISVSDYVEKLEERDMMYRHTSSYSSAAAGRISYFMGLTGRCIAIDTACSSSLVSLISGADDVEAGKSDMALCLGVQTITTPGWHIVTSQSGMLSEEGRCKTFDETANGYVRSEGCGGVLLASSAVEGAWRRAKLRGSDINQDGTSNGLTAPNGPSQTKLVLSALAKAGLSGDDVAVLECHGTGTGLGDPIELQAVQQSLGQGRTTNLVLASAKTNMGHCETAAGMVGLLKTLMCLQKELIPKHLHLNSLNHRIGTTLMESMRAIVSNEAIEWNSGSRIMGVSSFGFSGVNSHVILENFEEAGLEKVADGETSFLFFSAKTKASLEGVWEKFSAFVNEVNVAHVCFSSKQVRRRFPLRGASAGRTAEEVSRYFQANDEGSAPKTGVGFFASEDKWRSANLREELAKDWEGSTLLQTEEGVFVSHGVVTTLGTVVGGIVIASALQKWGVKIAEVETFGEGKSVKSFLEGMMSFSEAVSKSKRKRFSLKKQVKKVKKTLHRKSLRMETKAKVPAREAPSFTSDIVIESGRGNIRDNSKRWIRAAGSRRGGRRGSSMADVVTGLMVFGGMKEQPQMRSDKGLVSCPLPTYHFDRREYWIEESMSTIQEKGMLPAAVQGNDNSALRAGRMKKGRSHPVFLVDENVREKASRAVEESIREVLQLEDDYSFKKTKFLLDLGFDSLLAVEFMENLGMRLGMEIPATIVYDVPKLSDLKIEVATLISKSKGSLQSVTSMNIDSRLTLLVSSGAGDQVVYVAGMACRYSQSWNPEELWKELERGHDAVVLVPDSRWNWKDNFHEDRNVEGKTVSKWGGFFSGVPMFDSTFFNITPREARYLDPQHRMLLEVAWEAIESSGLNPMELQEMEEDTSVFVGIAASEYLERLKGIEDALQFSALGNTSGPAAGRISYFLGLQGNCLSIDTACSSSLVSVVEGSKDIIQRNSGQALCFGVHAMLSPDPFLFLSKAGMFSPTGRCMTFDERANGYVRAEGCGGIVLRGDEGIGDSELRLARVAGYCINQDGRSNGLAAPNGPSQTRLLMEAVESAGFQGRDMNYLECHGTGTSLGDPIEVRALAKGYGVDRGKEHPLIIGSAKSNFGHAETAAGALGIIKLLLSMNKEMIPRNLHLQSLNPYIGTKLMEEFRGVIPLESVQWAKTSKSRKAGVSSFGFSGTNCHVVFEEAHNMEQGVSSGGGDGAHEQFFLVVSVQIANDLGAMWKSYAKALKGKDIDFLRRSCYTSRNRRELFGKRLVIYGNNAAEFRKAVEGSAAKDAEDPECIEGVQRGASKPLKLAFIFFGAHRNPKATLERLKNLDAGFLEFFNPVEAHLNSLGHDLLGTECAETNSLMAFCVELAVAMMLVSWDVNPQGVCGYGFSQAAAAYLARGVNFKGAISVASVMRKNCSTRKTKSHFLSLFETEDTVKKLIALDEVKKLPEGAGKQSAFDAETAYTATSKPVGLFGLDDEVGPLTDSQITAPAFHSRGGVAMLEGSLSGGFDSPGLSRVRKSARTSFSESNIPSMNRDIAFVAGRKHVVVSGGLFALQHLEKVTKINNVRSRRCRRIPWLEPTVVDAASLEAEMRKVEFKKNVLMVMSSSNGSLTQKYNAKTWGKELKDYPSCKCLRKFYEAGINGIVGLGDNKMMQSSLKREANRLDLMYMDGWRNSTTGSPLDVAAFCFSNGMDVVWKDSKNPVPVKLPTYSFLKTPFLQDPRHVDDHGGYVDRNSRTSYCITWEDSTPSKQIGGRGGMWILVGECMFQRRVEKVLRAANQKVVVVCQRDYYSFEASSGTCCTRYEKVEDFQQLMVDVSKMKGAAKIGGIASFTALEGRLGSGGEEIKGEANLNLLKAISSCHWAKSVPRFWMFTKYAVCLGTESVKDVNPSQAGCWGLAVTAGREMQEYAITAVDVCSTTTADEVAAEFMTNTKERQVVLRPTGRFVPRLERMKADFGRLKIEKDHSVVIFGGLGEVGLAYGLAMMQMGCKNLILVDRKDMPESSVLSEFYGSASRMKVDVSVLRADVTNEKDMMRVAGNLLKYPPLCGIIHAVRKRDPKMIHSLTWNEVKGSSVHVREGIELIRKFFWKHMKIINFFLVCSSMTRFLGSPGSSSLAFGAAFANCYAEKLKLQGVPVLVVDLGPWVSRKITKKQKKVIRDDGYHLMNLGEGVRSTGEFLHSQSLIETHSVVVADFYWQALGRKFAGELLLEGVLDASAYAEVRVPDAAAGYMPSSAIPKDFVAPQGLKRELVDELVRRVLSEITDIPPHEITDEMSIGDIGLDSMSMTSLRSKLSVYSLVPLSVEDLMDQETVGDLSSFMVDSVDAGKLMQRRGMPINWLDKMGGNSTREGSESYVHMMFEPDIKDDESDCTWLANQHFFRGLLQVLLCVTILGFTGIASYPMIVWFSFCEENNFHYLLPLMLPIFNWTFMLLMICTKWLLIGRYTVKKTKQWSLEFVNWWFMERLLKWSHVLVGMENFKGTIMANFWCMAMGAKVSINSHIDGIVTEFDLVRLGNHSGIESDISAARLEEGELVLGPIVVSEGSWVGTKSVIDPFTTIPAFSRLDDLSYIQPGTQMLERSVRGTFTGSLASFSNDGNYIPNMREKWWGIKLLEYFAITLVRSIIVVAGVVPAFLLFTIISSEMGSGYAVGSIPFLTILTVIAFCLQILVVKWVFLGRVKPGVYPWQGWFAFRRQLVRHTYQFFEAFHLLLANAKFIQVYLRFLGMKIGSDCMIGAPDCLDWDVISLENGCFVAMMTTFKTWRYSDSSLEIKEIKMGTGSWVGTGTLVQGGAVLQNYSVMAGLSLAEDKDYAGLMSYKGSPAKPAGTMQKPEDNHVGFFTFWDSVTQTLEALWAYLMVGLCLICSYFVVSTIVQLNDTLASNFHYAYLFSTSFVCAVAVFMGAFSVVIIIHRRLLVRIQVGRMLKRPNWPSFYMMNLMELLFLRFLVPLTGGSSLFNVFYRFAGASIGRRAYVDPQLITDAELLHIGRASILRGSLVEAHSPPYGKWSMDMGLIRIGAYSTIGRGSLVLFPFNGGPHSVLKPLSRPLMGEDIKPWSLWMGSPANSFKGDKMEEKEEDEEKKKDEEEEEEEEEVPLLVIKTRRDQEEEREENFKDINAKDRDSLYRSAVRDAPEFDFEEEGEDREEALFSADSFKLDSFFDFETRKGMNF